MSSRKCWWIARFVWGSLTIAFLNSGLLTQANAIEQEGPFSRDAEDRVPLVTFTESVGIIAQPRSVPLLRIYHDGEIRVHLPRYTKNAGDYSMQLESLEMTQLIQLLHDKGVFTFDPVYVQKCKHDINSKAAQALAMGKPSAELMYHSDPETLKLEVRIDPLLLDMEEKVFSSPAQCSITWLGLRADVQRYPSLSEIQNLDAVIECLRAFCSHERLQRVVSD